MKGRSWVKTRETDGKQRDRYYADSRVTSNEKFKMACSRTRPLLLQNCTNPCNAKIPVRSVLVSSILSVLCRVCCMWTLGNVGLWECDNGVSRSYKDKSLAPGHIQLSPVSLLWYIWGGHIRSWTIDKSRPQITIGFVRSDSFTSKVRPGAYTTE